MESASKEPACKFSANLSSFNIFDVGRISFAGRISFKFGRCSVTFVKNETVDEFMEELEEGLESVEPFTVLVEDRMGLVALFLRGCSNNRNRNL